MRRRVPRPVRRFLSEAFEANVTGLSAMLAFNLLVSVFPLAVLGLFIAGQVFDSAELERAVLRDLRDLFPGPADPTLEALLRQIRRGSAELGVIALAASVWTGMSVWGALDTAFKAIYHRLESRSWLAQKRFALGMLVVVFLFVVATIAVPTLQGALVSTARNLPFGLDGFRGTTLALSLGVSVLLLFLTLSLIYRLGPNERVPWRGIWPGALAVTIAITIVDYVFPYYLSHISSISRFGTTLVFILIVLVWFYAVAFLILLGAVINAMRLHPEAWPAGEVSAAAGGSAATGPDAAATPEAEAPPAPMTAQRR